MPQYPLCTTHSYFNVLVVFRYKDKQKYLYHQNVATYYRKRNGRAYAHRKVSLSAMWTHETRTYTKCVLICVRCVRPCPMQ